MLLIIPVTIFDYLKHLYLLFEIVNFNANEVRNLLTLFTFRMLYYFGNKNTTNGQSNTIKSEVLESVINIKIILFISISCCPIKSFMLLFKRFNVSLLFADLTK